MLKQTLISLLAITSLIVSVQASAHQDNHRSVRHGHHQPQPKPVKPKFRINAAQSHQAALINKGVQNRSLTRHEERKLRDQQSRIAKLEHKLRHGGLNKWERKALKLKLIASGHLIRSYMSNREYRKARRHNGHSNNNHAHGNRSGHRSSGGSFSISIGH